MTVLVDSGGWRTTSAGDAMVIRKERASARFAAIPDASGSEIDHLSQPGARCRRTRTQGLASRTGLALARERTRKKADRADSRDAQKLEHRRCPGLFQMRTRAVAEESVRGPAARQAVTRTRSVPWALPVSAGADSGASALSVDSLPFAGASAVRRGSTVAPGATSFGALSR